MFFFSNIFLFSYFFFLPSFLNSFFPSFLLSFSLSVSVCLSLSLSVWAEECEGWEAIGLFTALKDVLVAAAAAAAPAAPAAAVAEEKIAAPAAEEKVAACHERAKSMSKRRQSVSLPPSSAKKTELTLLKELSQKNYLEQTHWFLNAYWAAEGKKIRFDDKPEECEKVWNMYHTMCKLDKEKGKDGNEIDEFGAHIFLEKTVGAITVKKMREVLVEIDVDFNQQVSLTEALIYTYKIDYKYLVTAVIDDSEAKALINAAKAAVELAMQRLQESKAAAEEAARAAEAAKAAAEEATASAAKAKEDAEAAAVAEQHAIDEENRAKLEVRIFYFM